MHARLKSAATEAESLQRDSSTAWPRARGDFGITTKKRPTRLGPAFQRKVGHPKKQTPDAALKTVVMRTPAT
jgi:hypothetical protein